MFSARQKTNKQPTKSCNFTNFIFLYSLRNESRLSTKNNFPFVLCQQKDAALECLGSNWEIRNFFGGSCPSQKFYILFFFLPSRDAKHYISVFLLGNKRLCLEGKLTLFLVYELPRSIGSSRYWGLASTCRSYVSTRYDEMIVITRSKYVPARFCSVNDTCS